MIAVLARGPADAVVQRVADRTAPARIRAVDPDLEVAFLDVAVQIEIGNARLDQREMSFIVDRQHAIHALEIQHDAAAHDRGRAAVGQVAAGRYRIQRGLVLVRNVDDLLHFLDAGRRERRGRQVLIGGIPEEAVLIAVQLQIFLAAEYPLLADGGLKLLQRRREAGRADIGGQYGLRQGLITPYI